jgi:hypothetical protein
MIHFSSQFFAHQMARMQMDRHYHSERTNSSEDHRKF